MGARRMIRTAAVVGMAASVLWTVALILEYHYGLRPPGDGSVAYKVDQAAFFLAQVGYLVLLIGLFRSRAGGAGLFGHVAIGFWVIGLVSIVLAQALGLFGINAIVLLPTAGIGQVLGSVLTSVAVWRAGCWTGWRRLAPAIWTGYFFVGAVSVIAAIPVLTIPAVAPNPRAPSPFMEALWQGAWFLLSLALYIEAGRSAQQSLRLGRKAEGPALAGGPSDR